MLNLYVCFVAMVIIPCVYDTTALNSCDSNSSEVRSLGMTVNSMKSDLGKWTDTFSARAEHSDTLSNISVDVLHNVTKCSGRRVIHIYGLIRNDHSATGSDLQIPVNKIPTIIFHAKHGTNVHVSNDGRTVVKRVFSMENNGVAFTNRALENDELFEVRLDQKGSRYNLCFGIGVLTKNPDDVEILPHIHFSKFAWMYHNNAIYNQNSEKRSNYGENINNLPVGTTFGVMKKPSGDIHFFVNGADQGVATSGISDPVYGIVELWHDAEKVTILKP